MANSGREFLFDISPKQCRELITARLNRLTEIAYTLVRLFQHFDRVERYYTDEEFVIKAEIVMQPGNGIKVGLWEAQDTEFPVT